MYIPIGPSKKDLYKIIIGLLLVVYLIFLGMYKPKAAIYNPGISTVQAIQENGAFLGSASLQNDIYNFRGLTLADSQGAFIQSVFETQTNVSRLFFNSYIANGPLPSNYFAVSKVLVNNYYTCTITSNTSNGDGEYRGTFLSGYCEIDYNASINYLSIYIPHANTLPDQYRISISLDNSPTSNAVQNQINNNVNNINNNLNDSSIDSSSANDLTSNSAFQDSNGLDAIIKAPLNFIQSLTSSTCSSISLTIPYIDANVSLPCMSTIYNKALGAQLVNLIALVINGVVLYRYCLKILELVHNAKNPNKDELEVLDL